MAHLYVAEPCNGSYIVLDSPTLIIGRNGDKNKPYELIDNKLLFPYKELSRSQIELSYDNRMIRITNIGRNKVTVILKVCNNNGSSESMHKSITPSESLNKIQCPCIISIWSHLSNIHYGTYYYGCSLFPPLEMLPISSMTTSAAQLLEKIESRLSFLVLQSNNLNIIFNHYNCPQLVLAEFIDCTNPQILCLLMDESKKVVNLEPYYITLVDIYAHLQETKCIQGFELPIDKRIHNLEKPPCLEKHRLAYEEMCLPDIQSRDSVEYNLLTYKQFIEIFLQDVAVLSINANLQSLFEASVPAESLAALNLSILEWTITTSSIVSDNGSICCQPDMGRLKSYYSRHKCLLIVYEEDESQNWVSTILESNEKNVLSVLMRSLLGTDKPVYIMSKKQFSGFIYYQDMNKLSHFIFPPSNTVLLPPDPYSHATNETAELISRDTDPGLEVPKEPSLRQSTPSSVAKNVEESEEIIDISDSTGSQINSEENAEVAEPNYLHTSQQPSQHHKLPSFNERKIIKVELPVLRIVNGYGIIDCDDISMSIWRELVNSLNNDNPGPCLFFKVHENNK